MANTKKPPVSALRRLKQDYTMIMNDPVPYVEAAPLPSNMLEWHYVIRGPEGSPYHNGIYHGKLRFPPGILFMFLSVYNSLYPFLLQNTPLNLLQFT